MYFLKNVTVTEYNEYKSRFNNNWSLRNEAIKHCEIDCKALYEVIINFGSLTFKNIKIDISTTPTLPSLAFKAYRSKFKPNKAQIAIVTGKMFEDINKAFYGGQVEMFKPQILDGKLIYQYDVNSLYPYNILNKNLFTYWLTLYQY